MHTLLLGLERGLPLVDEPSRLFEISDVGVSLREDIVISREESSLGDQISLCELLKWRECSTVDWNDLSTKRGGEGFPWDYALFALVRSRRCC